MEVIIKEAGNRLDKALADLTELSRSQANEAIKAGTVLVNGKSAKAKYAVKEGDVITYELPEEEVLEYKAEDIPLDIIYEDADVAVVNKPQGMVVHPSAGHTSGTLVNALMYHVKDLSSINGVVRPGIVHRIDKDTSGLLMIAKNDKAHNALAAELKDKYDKDPDILGRVTNEDLRKFGMIPEFLGRLPITVTLQSLTKELLVRILKEPRNAILKQYEKLLELDEVKLVFEDDALEWIAEQAMKKETGARALRSIIEDFMLDIMYEIPKDPEIGSVVITRAYLDKNGGPLIQMRGYH